MGFCLFCCAKSRRSGSDYHSKDDHESLSATPFEEKYELLELLGEGKTGKVYRVRACKTPRYEAAAKIVRKDYLTTPERQQAFREELTILKRVRHPSVLKLLDVFEDTTQYVIVTERVHGGELLDVICAKDGFKLSERDVAAIIRELMTVLEYLHSRGITHRDVKIDNILGRTGDVSDGIVLIDFGLAHKGRTGVADMSGMNGTCHYMAPEMFGRNSRYGCEIDIWAVGVVAYILLFGRFPFDARFLSQVEDKIVAGQYEFPSDITHEVSSQALRFVEHLLNVNVRERPTAAMVLSHPWLQLEHVSSKRFSESHMKHIRSFQDSRRAFGGVQPLPNSG